jgi:hypothetical protein
MPHLFSKAGSLFRIFATDRDPRRNEFHHPSP